MRLIISGGGTGGHIYPACSVYDKLEKSIPYCDKLYIGSRFGIEHNILKDKNMNFEEISARGFERGDYFYSFVSFFYLIRAFFETLFIMKKFKPDLVIGMGGFVSAPVILVAWLLGIETMIHEQNVVPGLSTTFLAKFANKILYSYKESLPYFSKHKNKLYFTGNPVRNEFSHIDREKARKKVGVKKDELLVLSIGGSSGAQKINELSVPIAEIVSEKTNLKYVHVTGKYYEKEYKADFDISKLSKKIRVLSYVSDMPSLLAASDLIVTRAGAITLAEMAEVNLPGVLIPSPNVARDHQTYNAKAYEKKGTTVVLKEDEIDNEKFKTLLLDLLENPIRLDKMRDSYNNEIRVNALNTIISLIYDHNLI